MQVRVLPRALMSINTNHWRTLEYYDPDVGRVRVSVPPRFLEGVPVHRDPVYASHHGG